MREPRIVQIPNSSFWRIHPADLPTHRGRCGDWKPGWKDPEEKPGSNGKTNGVIDVVDLARLELQPLDPRTMQ